jgi:hypothetical protein
LIEEENLTLLREFFRKKKFPLNFDKMDFKSLCKQYNLTPQDKRNFKKQEWVKALLKEGVFPIQDPTFKQQFDSWFETRKKSRAYHRLSKGDITVVPEVMQNYDSQHGTESKTLIATRLTEVSFLNAIQERVQKVLQDASVVLKESVRDAVYQDLQPLHEATRLQLEDIQLALARPLTTGVAKTPLAESYTVIEIANTIQEVLISAFETTDAFPADKCVDLARYAFGIEKVPTASDYRASVVWKPLLARHTRERSRLEPDNLWRILKRFQQWWQVNVRGRSRIPFHAEIEHLETIEPVMLTWPLPTQAPIPYPLKKTKKRSSTKRARTEPNPLSFLA